MADIPFLRGKCALVTGSVRGIGLASARRLAAAGCDVVLNGFDATADIPALQRDLAHEFGVRVVYSAADLRQPDAIASMLDEAVSAFGSVDVVVNNAVVRHAAPVEAFDPVRWDEAIAINVSAAFHTTRLAIPHMKRRGWGRIVNVSSIYGLRGAANRVGYVTGKTALIGLTRAVAMETVGQGITCNAVCPGSVETPVHDATIRKAMTDDGITRAEAERRFLVGKQRTGRLIPADDVAALIVFLCRPEAAAITGAALPMDDGWSAG